MKDHSSKIYFGNLHLILCILLFTLLGSCTSEHNKKNKHVLVIHSYEPENVTCAEYNKKIADNFKKNKVNVDITTLHLDCERFRAKEELEYMRLLLDSVKNNPPDIILVIRDQATYSLLACGHPLVNKTPIVFSGVTFPNEALLKQYPNVKGFRDKPEYLKTCEMIETLLGKVLIRYFKDHTVLGKLATQEFKKQLESVNIKYSQDSDSIGNVSVIEKLNRPEFTEVKECFMRNANGNELLWALSGMNKYMAYLIVTRDFTTMRIGSLAQTPCFSTLTEGFGFNKGILGGYITTYSTEAKESVGMACDILEGKDINQIQIQESKKDFAVDWEEMQRWNIPLSKIPKDWLIINMPFYVRHQTAIIIASSTTTAVILAFIIYILFLYARESRNKRAAQSELKKKKEFLSLVLENGNIFAWKYDIIEQFFTFDDDFFQTLQLPNRTFTKEEFITIIHPKDKAKVIKTFDAIIDNKKEKEKQTIQFRCKFSDSKYFWWEFRLSFIHYLEENEYALMGLCLNIQEFKDKEEELILARDLAAKAELKQSFLANMSHEIRTPLNAIVGFSNLLIREEEYDTEERQLFVSTINKNSELLLKLIGDILELSRIDSGNMSFHIGSCNLTELIIDIYNTQTLMMHKGVELKREIPDTPIFIETDKLRLNQVITNFINNAVKFTERGYILVGYSQDKQTGEILIYVSDTGKGIPEEEQKMIFGRFYKQDEFAQGTGLGLSICQVIIEKLDGRITLSSEINKGSKFTIHLPY